MHYRVLDHEFFLIGRIEDMWRVVLPVGEIRAILDNDISRGEIAMCERDAVF
ncbi:hypothetical protein ES708_35242 [subsurface metagenome]